jgi:hypothetical protein
MSSFGVTAILGRQYSRRGSPRMIWERLTRCRRSMAAFASGPSTCATAERRGAGAVNLI